MKRRMKFVAGVAVLLFAAFLLSPFSQKAQALGNNMPQAIAERREKAKSAVQQIRERLENRLCASAKTASSTTYIKSDTTLNASKTYSTNVTVYSGVTLTVTGGTLAVKGDLTVYGSLIVTGGSVVIYGDLIDFGAVSASGSGSIQVNKAASGSSIGGNIVVGSEDLEKEGHFSIGGSASVVVNKVTSDTGFQILDGTFGMDSAAASCTVNGSFFAGGSSWDDSGSPLLTQGTLTVNGDFSVDSAYADHPFAPGKDFNVVIGGPHSAPRQVYFADTSGSYFTNFDCSGASFTDDSQLSLHMDLPRSASIDCSGAALYFAGKTNGKSLALSAQYLVVNIGEDFDAQGGLTVHGDLNVVGTMEFSGGAMALDGTLWVNGRVDLSAGSLTLNGDLYQYGQYDTADDTCVFRASGDFSTMITGAGRTVYFDDPDHSFIRNLELGGNNSLSVGSVLPLRGLDSDLTVPGPVYFSGSLNGHKLAVQGAATVPAGTTAAVDGGTLSASGDLTVSGALAMDGYDDLVTVGGNFTANSADSALVSTLTNGRLRLQGGFTQSGAANSFTASGNHTTILCKTTGKQTVTFHSASAKFAHLAVLNDKMAPSDFSDATRFGDIVFSGTGLTGIDIAGGALTPAFSSSAGAYRIYLPQGTDAATVTFHPKFAAAKLDYSIDGGASQTAAGGIDISGVPGGGKKTLTVTVSAVNSAYADTPSAPKTLASASYTLTIETLSCDLGDLGLPAGAVVDNAFSPDTLSYTVDLPETVSSFTWAPTMLNPDSVLGIKSGSTYLGASTTVSLGLNGTPAVYTIETASQDVSLHKTYTVTFHRRNPVTNIKLSTGTLTPAFSPATASYSLTIPSTVPVVTVTAVRGTDCSALTFDGKAETGDAKLVSVDPGCTVTTVIAGTDSDDRSVTSYSVSITRTVMITGLTCSAGTLDHAFTPGIYEYTLTIPATASSVKITPVKFKTGVKSILINNKSAANITVKPRIGETLAKIPIQTVASDGKTKSPVYYVTVQRAPLVTDIHVTAGSLAFVPTTLSYTVFIPADTASVTVSADTATVKSCAVAKPVLSPGLNGSDSTTVAAVATDGKTKITYTVIAKRSVITGIEVSGGTLSPAFDPAGTSDKRTYTVSVPATTSSVTLTPDKAADCTSLKINTVEQASLTVHPDFGETVPVTITGSTASGTTAIYQVNVTRAALVTKIAIGTKGVALNQPFDPKVHSYTVSTTAASFSISVTKASKGVKTLTINGKKATSFTAKPAIGGTVLVDIIATATDGVTTAEYKITITRSSPLLNLTADTGALAPAFAPGTTTYGIELPATTGSVTLTPTVNTGCTCTNDATNASGPVPLNLAPGETKTVKFTADAADKSNPIVYTVTVHRADALTVINVNGKDLDLQAGKTDYTVNVGANIANATITPHVADGCGLAITGEAETATSTVLTPDIGDSATAEFTVTAGSDTVTYHVTVKRAPALSGIVADFGDKGSYEPAMDYGTLDYEVNLPASYGTPTVTLTVTPDGSTTVTMNDQVVTSLAVDKPADSNQSIVEIICTPKYGAPTVKYTVTITWGDAA